MRQPDLQKLQSQCDLWNSHQSIGAAVAVEKDDGSIFETRTRSQAWVLSGHTAVVMVEGISGAYLLSRVMAL